MCEDPDPDGSLHATSRAATRASIAEIAPLDDQERYTIAWALQWIDAGFPLWRTQRPATPPVHLAAYAVPVDGTRILLGAHRLSGLWLPCGGHVEPGEDPRTTAVRELQGELGSSAALRDERPFFISRRAVEPDHTDISLWFVFQAPTEELTVDPTELAEVRWFESTELPRETVPALGRFVDKLNR